MKVLKTILRWLKGISTWLWWDYDDEPVSDEYEGYDTSTHMED
jgi:hypothetical protein